MNKVFFVTRWNISDMETAGPFPDLESAESFLSDVVPQETTEHDPMVCKWDAACITSAPVHKYVTFD